MNKETFSLTNHARIRSSQRCIPLELIDLLITYGKRIYRSGAQVCFFDHRSIRQIKKNVPSSMYKMFEKKCNCYLVIDANGLVITVGRRFKRLYAR
jgi:hypothetical protein